MTSLSQAAEGTVSDGDAHRAIIQAIAQFRRGIFCPAELWSRVIDVVADSCTTQLLDDLPTDLEQVLCAAYYDRTGSLEVGHKAEIRRKIVAWCTIDCS